MAIVRELFDKGLVTSRDPALLQEGEVQRAKNCIYRPGHPGLWKAPGRATFNSTPLAAAVKGLRHLQFDGKQGAVTSLLLAHFSGSYSTAVFTSEAANFSLLSASVGTGTTIDAVHMFNRHYIFNGNAEDVANQVVKLDKDSGAVAIRNHGLGEVTENPSIALLASAGWPSGADFGDGYYFFFCTEVVNPGDIDELESAYSAASTPVVFAVSGTTDGITVTLPTTIVNSTATHRRLYMVGPKSTTAWSPFYFVEARQIAQVDIATTTIALGGLQSSEETKLPAATTGSSDWTNPNNILTQNGSYATRDADNAANALIARDFTFTTGSMTAVKGIRVGLIIKKLTDFLPTLAVEISVDGGVSYSAKKYVTASEIAGGNLFFYNRGFATPVFLGNSSDLWGRIISAPGTQLNNTNFRVRISASGKAGDSTDRIGVDVVRVTVYYGSTAAGIITKGKFYPTTSVRVGPTVTVVSANSPPSIASTGAVYEGQLVINDVSDPSIIRYSIVDQPDYFPSIYFINFETKAADIVRSIFIVNNILVVGMTQQILRVNHLPVAEDIIFERLYEPIALDHGIASTQGTAMFTIGGAASMLAYVSTTGLRYTDGIHSDLLSEDLDWAATVNVTKLDKCILVNEVNLNSLILYYIPAGDNTSTYPTRALYFSYHPSKIKANNKLSVSGPVTVDVASSTVGYQSFAPIHVTGNSTGTVSVEDRGAGSEEVDIVTREFYPAGIGASFRARKHWLRYAASDPGVLATVVPFIKNAGMDYISPSSSSEWTIKSFRNNTAGVISGEDLTLINRSGLAKLKGDFAGESFALRITSDRVVGQALGNFAVSAYGFDVQPRNERTHDA